MSTIPSALITNAITNALHSGILLLYFLSAFYQYLKNNPRFRGIAVFLFLFLFIMKILGAIVHYYADTWPTHQIKMIWATIALCLGITNYITLYSIEMPGWIRRFFVFLSLIIISFYIYKLSSISPSFIYLAFANLSCILVAAYYSLGLARIGLIGVAVSDIAWPIMRKLLAIYLRESPPAEYRYDNDIYHFMLIASTSLLYLSFYFAKWRYPKEQTYI